MYYELSVFYGILIPFLGTSLGAACVFFMKHDMSERLSRDPYRVCCGGDGGSIHLEFTDPGDGSVGRDGKFAFVPAVAVFGEAFCFCFC